MDFYGFVNATQDITTSYYFTLGFIEGAFAVDGLASNVTECRIRSIRFMNNATLLSWYSQINYGVDKIIKYATELAT